jgi:hypothetical protein
MTSWVRGRASLLVLVFGTPCGCSNCPPAAEPVAAAPVPLLPAPLDQNSTSGSDGAPVPRGPASAPIVAERDKRLVLGSDGQPIGEGGPSRYTSGGHQCPPPAGSTCEIGKNESCEVHDRVSCGPDCDGYRTQYYSCENGTWGLRKTGEASCDCAPKKLPFELAACTTRYVSVSPSVSPNDGCSLGLTCAGRELWVECDGENDGTNTSLCECWRDRQEQRIGNLFPGEGPEACFAAAADCSKAR